jgi:hypothetical protein
MFDMHCPLRHRLRPQMFTLQQLNRRLHCLQLHLSYTNLYGLCSAILRQLNSQQLYALLNSFLWMWSLSHEYILLYRLQLGIS